MVAQKIKYMSFLAFTISMTVLHTEAASDWTPKNSKLHGYYKRAIDEAIEEQHDGGLPVDILRLIQDFTGNDFEKCVNDWRKSKNSKLHEYYKRAIDEAIEEQHDGGLPVEILRLIQDFTGNDFEECVNNYWAAYGYGYPDGERWENDSWRDRVRKAKSALSKWVDCKHCGSFHNEDNICAERHKSPDFQKSWGKCNKYLDDIRKMELTILCDYRDDFDSRMTCEAKIGNLQDALTKTLKTLRLEKNHPLIVEMVGEIENREIQRTPIEQQVNECRSIIKWIKEKTQVEKMKFTHEKYHHRYSDRLERWNRRKEKLDKLLAENGEKKQEKQKDESNPHSEETTDRPSFGPNVTGQPTKGPTGSPSTDASDSGSQEPSIVLKLGEPVHALFRESSLKLLELLEKQFDSLD